MPVLSKCEMPNDSKDNEKKKKLSKNEKRPQQKNKQIRLARNLLVVLDMSKIAKLEEERDDILKIVLEEKTKTKRRR